MYLGDKNMRLWALLFILPVSILLLSGNVYSLNLNDPVDKYSLNTDSFPFAKKKRNDHINFASNSMIPGSFSLTKCNNTCGFKDTFNQSLINIPMQNIKTNNCCNLIDEVRECLISKLASLIIKNKIDSKTTLICNPKLLLAFYLHREVKPVWVTKDGLNNKAEVLIKIIIEADHEGLDSETYHQKDILTLLTDIKFSMVSDTPDPAKLAELDLLLTDAFFSYGFHLSEGIVDPYSKNLNWYINKPKRRLGNIFQTVLYDGKMEGFVDVLQPHHSGYLRLKLALLKYQKIKRSGCWHEVPSGGKLRKGDYGTRIAALRSRLIISGDSTDSTNSNQDYFDEVLEDGVRRFQARHGLKVDGIVGSKTLLALNVPVEDRIRQIRLNMERWRWLPQDLGKSYLMVNTANFKLNVIENEQSIKSIKAIVGKIKRRTPILSRKITYLELNPYWNIPQKIALNDILPCIKKKPCYLADHNIRVFENWEENARELNPESIDWAVITKKKFVYKLRQDPANSNALGRVKFVFPNEFSIYLHDTPARNLFNMTRRAFSSGCIRIEKPIELAAYLLQNNSKWSLEKLVAAVNRKKNKTIFLSDPIKIYILYWTAWVYKDGIVNFRDDIYGRDRRLSIALNEKTTFPKVLYEENSVKKYFSSRILPVSNRSNINMNKIRAWVVADPSNL
ncbi:MAG: L,D-transpeptidase YcbB [Desulfobacteraceae bacterium Eth-SRB2]|nr:MAG: L,D-transpeptidase YcbB [Desulfobacteraceae bacterium Eth-SRB2]